jgi:protease-4
VAEVGAAHYEELCQLEEAVAKSQQAITFAVPLARNGFMSETPSPTPSPPTRPPYSYYTPPRGGSLLGCAFAVSLGLNLIVAVVLFFGCLGLFSGFGFRGETSSVSLPEHLYSGSAAGKDKVAIVDLDGVILEGLLGFVHKEIDQAARDDNVKAVVLRINSPGGSVTASDDLHRRLLKLRDGDPDKKTKPKPLVVSMASLAASGGYYVAMPAKTLFAEPSTMTGSIGVFAAFPNVSGTLHEIKASMIVIKQGEIKDSGSPFKEMTPKEKQVWQDLVDHGYEEFVRVVEEGRPGLKGKMLETLTIKPRQAGKFPEPGQDKPYERYRADGGLFTADQAEKFGLVDRIGYLEDAIHAAKDAAGLSGEVKVVRYEKPKTPLQWLLGAQQRPPEGLLLEPGRLGAGLTPRLWYLAPGCELAGVLSAMEAK